MEATTQKALRKFTEINFKASCGYTNMIGDILDGKYHKYHDFPEDFRNTKKDKLKMRVYEAVNNFIDGDVSYGIQTLENLIERIDEGEFTGLDPEDK